MWSKSRLPSRLQTTEYATALEAAVRRAGSELLDLTVSNPTKLFEGHRERAGASLAEAAREAIETGYEPTPHGLPTARAAIRSYYRDHGVEVDERRITVTASTSEAYTWLAKIFADPGCEVLVPTPSYPLFEHLMSLENVRAVPYRFRYDGTWHLDAGDLVRQLEACDDPRAIACVSPNNPTGHVLSETDVRRLCEIATRRRLPLVVDEVFLDFGLDAETPTPIARHLQADDGLEAPLCCTLSGLSKSAGLPDAKFGWIALRGEAELCAEARRRLEFVADTFLSCSTVAQLWASRVLPDLAAFHETVRRRTRSNLATLRDGVEPLAGCDVYPTQAGWYGVVRIPDTADPEERILELVRDRSVLVQPGFLYDFEHGAHLIVSLLPAPATFEAGVERLCDQLRSE